MVSLHSLCFTKKIMFVSMFAFSFALCQCKSDNDPFVASLKILCDMTLYPNTCYDSLSPLIDSKNNYNTHLFYNLSVQVSIDEVSRVYTNFSADGTLTQILQNTKENITQSALESCREFLSLALYDLNWSLPTNDSVLTLHETRTNFRTWLSAARTNLETCIDEVEFAPDEVRKIVAQSLDNSTKHVTTSLAIISKIDDYMSSQQESPTVDKIETSSGSEPSWLSSKDRKLLQNLKKGMKPDVVVAADGSGDYQTITEAIDAVPKNSSGRFVIHVKKGVYHENVKVAKETWNVFMYGDGMNVTIVSSNRSHGSGISTAMTATFAVFGRGFIARDMGFENSAGARQGQAVALLSASDLSVFYRCLVDSYQDTLYTHSGRQFYQACKIYGTMDFIFGNSAVVIQNSNILVKRPMPSLTANMITAQGKENPYSKTGISIQKCNITAAENLHGVRTFLGRPWKDYSTTVVMESKLERLIDPEGWSSWLRSVVPPDTIFYVEYNNCGPGADITNRPSWKGVKVKNTDHYARNFTVRSFIYGELWLPSTGVPFQPDL